MYDILQLNEMLLPELKDIAEKLVIPEIEDLSKEEIVYKILDMQSVTPIETPPVTSESKAVEAPVKKRKPKAAVTKPKPAPSKVPADKLPIEEAPAKAPAEKTLPKEAPVVNAPKAKAPPIRPPEKKDGAPKEGREILTDFDGVLENEGVLEIMPDGYGFM